MIHALAEESVVYRALEGVQSADSGTRADDRFAEHEVVETIFDRLSRIRPGSIEWQARLDEIRDLIARHVEGEHEEMFARLARQFDADKLREMGRNFELARDKLTLLEEAKAAPSRPAAARAPPARQGL
jgi:Hemerythrin HHE cation binding domain